MRLFDHCTSNYRDLHVFIEKEIDFSGPDYGIWHSSVQGGGKGVEMVRWVMAVLLHASKLRGGDLQGIASPRNHDIVMSSILMQSSLTQLQYGSNGVLLVVCFVLP